MKIQGVGTGAIGPSMVDGLMDMERAPIDSAKQRRERVVTEKNEFKSFDGLLSKFSTTLDGLKTPSSFRKLTAESSHPDMLDANISGLAAPGSYEFEINALARADRQLAFGFADADKTPVGFGYMRVGVADQLHEVTIEPGATLKDVASRINEAIPDVRAMVINTGQKDDPFRLMVSSVKSGEAAQVDIDEDTTFTEFKNQVKGQDLHVNFEGVSVRRDGNSLNDLIDGVQINAKKAEPGTRVQLNIRNDTDKTADAVKDFTKQYNDIAAFTRKQSQRDPETGKSGTLSGDSAVRSSMRRLQGELSAPAHGSTNAKTLMDIGITTDAKTGELRVDDNKLKEALSSDYEGVTALFANSERGPGLAQKLSDTIHQLHDRQSGAITTRLKGYEQRIRDQDQNIERQTERMNQKRASLERTYAALDAKLASTQQQSEFFGPRMSTPQPAPAGGPKAA